MKYGNKKDIIKEFEFIQDVLNTVKNPDNKSLLYEYLIDLKTTLECLEQKSVCVESLGFPEFKKTYKNMLQNQKKLRGYYIDSFIENKGFHKEYLESIFDDSALGKELFIDDDTDDIYFSEKDFYYLFREFCNSMGFNKEYRDLVKNRDIFSYTRSKYEDSLGFSLFNPYSKNSKLFVGDMEYSMSNLLTLAHEFGHKVDLEHFLDEHSSKEFIDYFYKNNFTEVMSRLFEKSMSSFLLSQGIETPYVINRNKEYIVRNYDFILGSFLLTLLDDKTIRNLDYYLKNPELLMKYFEEKFEDLDDLDELLKIGIIDTSDVDYSYGDIVSTFLLDEFICEGFYSPRMQEFLVQRASEFSPSYFYDSDFSPECYNDLKRKEYEDIAVLEKTL